MRKVFNSDEEQILASAKRPQAQRRQKSVKKQKNDCNVTDISSATLFQLSDSSSDEEM